MDQLTMVSIGGSKPVFSLGAMVQSLLYWCRRSCYRTCLLQLVWINYMIFSICSWKSTYVKGQYKLYVNFWLCWFQAPNPHIVQRSPVYVYVYNAHIQMYIYIIMFLLFKFILVSIEFLKIILLKWGNSTKNRSNPN